MISPELTGNSEDREAKENKHEEHDAPGDDQNNLIRPIFPKPAKNRNLGDEPKKKILEPHE